MSPKTWKIIAVSVGAVVVISAASGGSKSGTTSSPSTAAQTTESAKPPAPKQPEMTSGQANALDAAKSYLESSGFSKAGLIDQLSSSAGDGYSKADSRFAAEHAGADWNAEAVEAAKSYLDSSSFSKSGLIEQLSSSAGDQFTSAQARYAASKVY